MMTGIKHQTWWLLFRRIEGDLDGYASAAVLAWQKADIPNLAHGHVRVNSDRRPDMGLHGVSIVLASQHLGGQYHVDLNSCVSNKSMPVLDIFSIASFVLGV